MWQQGGLYPPHCLAGRAVEQGMGCGNKVVCNPLIAWLVELLMRGWGVATRWSVPPHCLAGRAVDEGMGCGNKVVCTPLIAWLVELLNRGWGVATRWSVTPSLPGW